jgi:cytochrome c biogenesis protein CcmG/thiol:disulfide interchange protein DsbE
VAVYNTSVNGEAKPRAGIGIGDRGRQMRALRGALWALVGVMTVAWLFPAGGLEALLGTFRPAPPAAPVPEVGHAAPELRLPLAGGGEIDLAQYRGRVVLLNFWATWCAPCRAEMPALDRAYRQHRDRGLEILGVDLMEKEDQVLQFLGEVGVHFPSAIDPVGDVARRYRALGLPTTFLIDREGVIRDVRVGPLTEQMLEERLARVL